MTRTAALALPLLLAACVAQPVKPAHVALAAPAAPPNVAVDDLRACVLPAPPPPRTPAPIEVKSSAAVAGDACEDDDLSGVIATILRDEGKSAPTPTQWKPWDRVATPKYLDRVRARHALTAAEIARLRQTGFVALERLHERRYDEAYHDIHQSELPVYVTVDSVMHAVFASHDELMAEYERKRVQPSLAAALAAMHCAVPKLAGAWPKEIAHDVELYLTVARELLAPASMNGSALFAEVEPIVAALRAANGHEQLELFGRPRMVNAGLFTPRGHYTGDLQHYFRAASWLFQLELNLVSRSCRSSSPKLDPSETPREAVVALALSELAERSGALPHLAHIEKVWGALAGDRREDVSLHELSRLRRDHALRITTVDATAAALRAAIGDKYRRTFPSHIMPPGTSELPAITTVFGPRLVRDALSLARLGEPWVPNKSHVTWADAAYVLGHDRARDALPTDASYLAALADARSVMNASEPATDAYHAWLRAIRALATPPSGAVPSYMKSKPFADLRMSTALAAYGQLRHTNVLLAAQPQFISGCKIPDGFVEPAPATYDALVDYAATTRALFAEIDPEDSSGAGRYFASLEEMVRVLRVIQRHELEGRALTGIEKQFLALIAEVLPHSVGYTKTTLAARGWYYDMFPSVATAARPAAFVADYGGGDRVSYLGVANVRLGLFVVDIGGPPRVMVGPIAATYETTTSNVEPRLDDEAASRLPRAKKAAPWEKSYTIAATPQPDMSVRIERDHEEWHALTVTVRPLSPLGKVVIEPLDHHGKPLRSLTVQVDATATVVLTEDELAPIERVRVVAKNYPVYLPVPMETYEVEAHYGDSHPPAD